jgi:hypothetical protein
MVIQAGCPTFGEQAHFDVASEYGQARQPPPLDQRVRMTGIRQLGRCRPQRTRYTQVKISVVSIEKLDM